MTRFGLGTFARTLRRSTRRSGDGGTSRGPLPRRFAGAVAGSAAVEFTFLAFPFMLIMFALLETGIVFVADVSLTRETQRMARQIRTGKITNAATSEAAFRSQLCAPISHLFTCANLQIDLRSHPSYGDLPRKPPIADGLLTTGSFAFQRPEANQIMTLRVYYERPLYAPMLSGLLANLANGRHLMGAASIFRTEPF